MLSNRARKCTKDDGNECKKDFRKIQSENDLQSMDGLIPSTEEGLVTLASPKLLTLGNAQINLAFHSYTRNFGFAEVTHTRKCSNKFGISLVYS